MTLEKTIELLHPNTTKEAIRRIEENGGDAIKAIEEACVIACEALEKMEKQVNFPCNIGDTVYEIAYPTTANIVDYKAAKPIILEHIITSVAVKNERFRVETTYVSQFGYDSNAWFYWDDHYLYKTREEAETKAKEWLERKNEFLENQKYGIVNVKGNFKNGSEDDDTKRSG